MVTSAVVITNIYCTSNAPRTQALLISHSSFDSQSACLVLNTLFKVQFSEKACQGPVRHIWSGAPSMLASGRRRTGATLLITPNTRAQVIPPATKVIRAPAVPAAPAAPVSNNRKNNDEYCVDNDEDNVSYPANKVWTTL